MHLETWDDKKIKLVTLGLTKPSIYNYNNVISYFIALCNISIYIF